MQRLREREVDSKIVVTDAEGRQLSRHPSRRSRAASANTCCRTCTCRCRNRRAPTRSRRGASGRTTRLRRSRGVSRSPKSPRHSSDAPDATSGGSLDWRTPARLPTAFIDVTKTLKKGEVSNVTRSPAGFHVVLMVDQRNRNQAMVVDQTHARHILIKVNEGTSETEGKVKIDRLRERLGSGAKFEDLARVNSEDRVECQGRRPSAGCRPATPCPISRRRWTSSRWPEVSTPVRTAVRLAPDRGRRATQAGHHAGPASRPRRASRCASARATSSSRNSCGSSAIARTVELSRRRSLSAGDGPAES